VKTFQFKLLRTLVLLCVGLFGSVLFADESRAPLSDKKKVTKNEIVETSDPDSQANTLLYIKGRQMALNGEYAGAAAMLEQALKADPESTIILHQLGEVYLKLGNYGRASELLAKVVKKEPNNPGYRSTLGAAYAASRNYDLAQEQYEKVLELNPKDRKAPLLIGIVQAEKGDLKKAISTLTKAIKVNPDNYMAYFYRAKVYLERDDLKRTAADLNKCLEIRPSFQEAGLTLGMLHERSGEVEKAIAVYNRIQGNGRFRKRLAQLYLQKNELKKAQSVLLQYIEGEPDDYTARVKIALIYYELKKFDEAATWFKRQLGLIKF